MSDFYVYILKCSDDSYYVGHTDNIDHRMAAHVSGAYQCYTTSRLPVSLVFVQSFPSRIEALTAEHQIKKWSRKKKEALIRQDWEGLKALAKKKF